jgi:hypothetical protein
MLNFHSKFLKSLLCFLANVQPLKFRIISYADIEFSAHFTKMKNFIQRESKNIFSKKSDYIFSDKVEVIFPKV